MTEHEISTFYHPSFSLKTMSNQVLKVNHLNYVPWLSTQSSFTSNINTSGKQPYKNYYQAFERVQYIPMKAGGVKQAYIINNVPYKVHVLYWYGCNGTDK
jgi:hypothetical protein